jgi:hypothetical protein
MLLDQSQDSSAFEHSHLVPAESSYNGEAIGNFEIVFRSQKSDCVGSRRTNVAANDRRGLAPDSVLADKSGSAVDRCRQSFVHCADQQWHTELLMRITHLLALGVSIGKGVGGPFTLRSAMSAARVRCWTSR